MYQYIKEYYDMGFYSKDDVKYFVSAGWITADEYRLITDEEYVA
ncbi:XkdX family protein [Paenibacillus hexagrammi]|uniref:XkdX family protein n=1 Tax=Paenibacillus hexagrammi TaxID=2908839 RepID=A0ABY3SSS0_9BACL|nr:XkdX family protein [Paenibacillus sp. YPD9-1]UJF36620.1 XkdX family protein [Paenibacillus sp. YPD9-1]